MWQRLWSLGVCPFRGKGVGPFPRNSPSALGPRAATPTSPQRAQGASRVRGLLCLPATRSSRPPDRTLRLVTPSVPESQGTPVGTSSGWPFCVEQTASVSLKTHQRSWNSPTGLLSAVWPEGGKVSENSKEITVTVKSQKWC